MIKRNHKSGFTLLETFIAITILIVAVAGPLTIAQRSLSSSQYSQNRVIAYYLAQDAVEYIRSVRDNLALQGDTSSASGASNWIGYDPVSKTYPISNCFVDINSSGCLIDYSALYVPYPPSDPVIEGTVIRPCSNGGCSAIEIDPNGTIYDYSSAHGATPTNFTRTVKIQLLNANEAWLKVIVSWQTSVVGSGNSVTLTEDLFNYRASL